MDRLKGFLLPFLIATLPIVAVFFPAKHIGFYVAFVCVVSLFEKNKLRNLKKNIPHLKPYIFFLAFCLLATVLSKDILLSLKSLERYVSLLLIPIVVFMSDFDEKRLKIVFRSFVILMLLVSLFSLGRLIWFVNTFGDWIEVMRGVNKNDTYVQFKYPHLMWDVHPSYWSYLMLIVNIILLNNKYFNKLFKKRITILLLVLFNINLLYLSARIPLFINLCIHVVSITIFFKKKLKYLLIFYAAIGTTILVSYFQMPFLKYKFEAVFNDDRFFLWSVAYEKSESNTFVLGEGFGTSRAVMEKSLKEINDPRVDYKGNEIHNQYLSMLLETGIIGVLFLLYIYIRPNIFIRNRLKITSSLPSVSIILLVLMSSLIEPFFSVIKGIIIFAVFSALFKLRALREYHQVIEE